jgi:mono/diheme cytochrome c family protein
MASRAPIAACLAVAALAAGGCGSQGVQVPKDDPTHAGAVAFAAKCGSCHTIGVAGTQGSTTNIADKENVDGPNFDQRTESKNDVLFAIANGGFSGAIMPENIATGREAELIAAFLEKYSGREKDSGS